MSIQTIKERLNDYKQSCEAIEGKQYNDFRELEKEYCDLINVGSKIRADILSDADNYDKNIIDILNNKTTDFSLLPDGFEPLEYVILLKSNLIQKYQDYSKILIDEKKYEDVIIINNQLHNWTGNYLFIQNIADTYLKGYENKERALEIYQEIEPQMKDNAHYNWGLARVYEAFEDYYTTLKYMQKAIKIELYGVVNA
ncbi:hypothetical protein IJ541_11180 [bacterium]|nr:hypothetical protein [bacterium]